MTLDQTIEAVLFAAGKPLGISKLAALCGAEATVVETAVQTLAERLDASNSGIMLQKNGREFELVTHPDASEAVSRTVAEEAQGELTRPSLEALTILAYRGPMTRPELEQIRGVNCTLILRNLMVRGLVEQGEIGVFGQPTFAVTFDFLNHLGLKSVQDLPDYEKLHGHAAITDVLNQLNVAVPTQDSIQEPKPNIAV